MSDSQELKAGHPPAVKAGGMRIVTKHRAKDQDSDAYDEKYKDTVNSIGPAVKPDVKVDVVLTGGTKTGKDVQPEAVKAFHDKPQPKHTYHSPPKQTRINQPRGNY